MINLKKLEYCKICIYFECFMFEMINLKILICVIYKYLRVILCVK